MKKIILAFIFTMFVVSILAFVLYLILCFASATFDIKQIDEDFRVGYTFVGVIILAFCGGHVFYEFKKVIR